MTDATTQNSDQGSIEDPDLVTQDDENTDEAELWNELEESESNHAPLDAGSDDDDEFSQSTSDANSGDDESRSDQSGKDTKPDDRDSDQIWATAAPEQKAAYEAAQEQLRKLEQADRSNRGRLSALQRQINDLTKKPAAPSQEGANTDQAGEDGFLATPDWKSFNDEYPEVAGPLGKLISKLEAKITVQEKELSAIGSERRNSAIEEQATILAKAHPDWETVTQKEENGFMGWLNDQPRHIQEAAYRNADEVVDAAEAADVVGRFKNFLRENGKGNDAPSKGVNDNSRLANRRAAQLESSVSERSRGPGVVAGIAEDGDPETIWKQFEQLERKREARA